MKNNSILIAAAALGVLGSTSNGAGVYHTGSSSGGSSSSASTQLRTANPAPNLQASSGSSSSAYRQHVDWAEVARLQQQQLQENLRRMLTPEGPTISSAPSHGEVEGEPDEIGIHGVVDQWERERENEAAQEESQYQIYDIDGE